MKRFLKGLLNAILVIVLFDSVSILTLSYGIGSSLSYNNIKKTVKTTIKDNIKKQQETILEDSNIMTDVYEEAEKYNVSKEDIDTILSSEKLQDLAADFVYSSMIDNEKELSQEEMNTTIEEAVKEINQEKEIINDETKEELKSIVSSNYEEINNLTPIDQNVTNEDVVLKQLLDLITNKKLRIIFITCIVVSIILLILLNLKKLVWLRKISLTTLISGICNFVLSYSLIPVIKSLEGEGISNIVKQILSPLHTYSLAITAFSIIMFIVYCVLRKTLYKEKKEEVEE